MRVVRTVRHGALPCAAWTLAVACSGGVTVPAPPAAAGAVAGTAAEQDPADQMPVVRLGAIDAARPEVALTARNPFQYGQSLPEAAPGPASDLRLPPSEGDDLQLWRSEVPPAQEPTGLRLIGHVEAADPVGRIAVLSDGQTVIHGREGEIIDGRYRLIGVEPMAVTLEALQDGRRHVLRSTESSWGQEHAGR